MSDIYKPSEQIAENANCSIAKLAREIADAGCARPRGHAVYNICYNHALQGLEAGMKLQRERDAVIAEEELVEIYDDTPNETDATCNAIVRHIASAIRSAL